MCEWAVMMFNVEQSRCASEQDGFTTIKLITTTLKNETVVDALDGQIYHLRECVEDIFYNIESINITAIIDSSVSSDAVPINDALDNKAVEVDVSINDEIIKKKTIRYL